MEKEIDEIKIEKKKERTDSYFDGKFIEYLGYKLLAFIITIVTLTIAKPWADKLLIDYKINHTHYNGKKLKFEGSGSSLFVQRFKWCFLTIITIGIYSIWVPIKKEQWIISNIHFEDEDLVEGESFFDGKLLGLVGVNLCSYIITLISFGLLFPYTICYKQKWIAKHTIINRKKIIFKGKALSIIGHYLLWWILSIITIGIYAIWVPIKMYGWEVRNTHLKLKDDIEEKQNIIPIIISIFILIGLIVGLVIVIPKTDIPAVISGDKKIEDIFSGNKNIFNGNKTSGEAAIESNSGEVNIESNSNSNTKSDNSAGHNNNVKSSDSGSAEVKEEIPQSRCNEGYVFNEVDNLCYTLNGAIDAITTCTESGDACGVGCPESGYRISWNLENGFDGQCYKYQNPNY